MKTIIQQRISALREAMKHYNMGAYIIPSSDPHLSEYPADCWKSRQWISGFTGSAGTVVITADKAGLWTDSRYFLQAAKELEGSGIELYKMGLPETPGLPAFILRNLQENETVGLDGQTYSVADAEELNLVLKKKKITLDVSRDLIHEIWIDRPAIPGGMLFELPVEYSGKSTSDKLEAINTKLHEAGADGLVLCALDEIAWTFNIRGNDVEYNPVVVSYAFISEEETVLFILPGKITHEMSKNLQAEGVTLADYSKITSYLAKLKDKTRLYIDPKKTNFALYNALPFSCEVIEGVSPVAMLKSIKNEKEIEGFSNAMVRDGVALTRFFIWMEKSLSAGKTLTEISISEKLAEFRNKQALYVSESFETIAGYKGHGAIVHYGATPESNATLAQEGLLLIDSGAQYFDGTTDITRTIALGEPTEAMMKDFTRVLKGHISLAKCKFPQGTRGSQLDILARKALWDNGINYMHGTGHGIGHFLNVHEGPQSIRMEENPVALQPGMVISNEPGVYRTDEYGIRIENLILVREDSETEFGKFYSFETLTLCPIDRKLIITSQLSARERAWLNKYHQRVYEKLSPFLFEEEKEWLKNKTAEL
ncbi:MAG: aminopeptidase P family protein [Parabacteroides sp.]|jgi:Xaa-Pro aminopeptidase|nr:aminopeptidase P family protein [Parabacteroides sp.]MBP8759411.1 aminopeptidase P family protein [Parabacteroides sp.]MBP9479891.1 aminopeptidase P family protein [Parabacteroides sp.]MBP9579559.1 aminopeptidase P family protein [Parabacteroides sp.]MDD2415112.1 aminopeptidase P family protein [Parabacteroides sp.]